MIKGEWRQCSCVTEQSLAGNTTVGFSGAVSAGLLHEQTPGGGQLAVPAFSLCSVWVDDIGIEHAMVMMLPNEVLEEFTKDVKDVLVALQDQKDRLAADMGES